MSTDHPTGTWEPHPASGPSVGVGPEIGGAAYRVLPRASHYGTGQEMQPPYADGFVHAATAEAQALNAAVADRPSYTSGMYPRQGPVGDLPQAPPVPRTPVSGPIGDDVGSATHAIVANSHAKYLP